MRTQVLAWLAGCGRSRVLYSDLSRALVTNNRGRRARSTEARHELRTVLTELESDGLVVLSQVNANGRGQVGMAIELTCPTHPVKGAT